MAADAAPIILRIGAALDSTVEKSFSTVEKRAEKAAQNVERANERTTTQAEKNADRKTRAEEKAAAKLEAAAQKASIREQREADKTAQARIKASDRATAAAMRGFDQIGRAARAAEAAEIRSAQNAAAAKERAARRSAFRMGERFATGTANTATRFLTPYAPLAGFARRTMGDLARGAGVQFDVGGILGRAIDLNSRATTLSANAYQEGAAGAAGVRQDPGALARESRQVAKKYGLDAGDVLGGLERFTAVAGDLETARKLMDDLAKLAVITGSNMENVVDAAGQVGATLKDTPDKAQRVADVMRVMAGQGRLGAVELKELATQMSKVAASAGRIEGDPAENIKRLGALMQLARQRGGANNGMQAATSIARLADTVVTPARARAFEKAGIKTTTDSGMIRDLPAIIFDVIGKYGKQPIKMKELFASSIGSKPAEALANIFRQGEDPKAAFEKFLNAGMGKKQQDEDLARALDTPKAKIARFQANLDELGDKLMVSVIPAFERLAPTVLNVADELTAAIEWAANNMGSAAATAVGLSIARAGIESTLRSGIERLLLGEGGGNAPKLGMTAGGIGAALTIASLAVATVTIGEAIIAHMANEEAANQRKVVEASAEQWNLNQKADRQLASGDVEGAQETAKQASITGDKAIKDLGQPTDHSKRDLLRAFADELFGSGEGVFGIRKATGTTDQEIMDASQAREAAESKTREQLLKEQGQTNKLLTTIAEQLSSGINVLNQDTGGAGGRAGQL